MSDKTKKEPTALDKAIASVFHEMESVNADSAEFARMVEQLDKLHKMKTYDKSNRVSTEALLSVVGNLAGIFMILNFERANVLTSKAVGFVLKSKI